MANFFTDRVVEHPGRITLTATGGSDEYDVDRAEGTVTTAGTPFNATTFNGMLDQYGAWYGTCTTAASTAAKEVTCPGFTLVTGSTISVFFAYGSQYDGQITLNVNSTGAKNVMDNGQYASGQLRCAWDSNQLITFVYTGTNWNMISGPIITDSDLEAIESTLNLSTYIGRLSAILTTMISSITAKPTLKIVTASGTTGSSVYSGMYYVDVGKATPSGYTYLGVSVTETGNNRFAVVHRAWEGNYRVFTTESGVPVSFKIIYYKTGL